MNSTIEQDIQCSAERHKVSSVYFSYQRGRAVCKECSKELGNLYDGEWTRKEKAALLSDYQAARLCSCGGPTCGPNAKAIYCAMYPAMAFLFS